MADPSPFLIIQPRRLGDLILTFPLIIDLQRLYPSHPVWVAGEESFYRELVPLAPQAVFFPAAQLPQLIKNDCKALINLGPGDAVAELAGQCKAERKFGRILSKGRLAINGFWHLYRESLTQNNYHNLFHWADLFRLDLNSPLPKLARPKPKPAGSGRIGLFIGASEKSKRPGPQFWATLANQLAVSGFKPVLLGGPDEAALGQAIMTKRPAAINFCGKTSLGQLSGLMRTLDLMITPDTGPMHLADWLSVPVLNLSMGNVSAFETGPLSAGQHILAAGISCYGCWQCRQKAPLCHSEFRPANVARIAACLVKGETPEKSRRLALYRTGRDEHNLYQLQDDNRKSANSQLGHFWQAAFLAFSGATTERLENLKMHSYALRSEYGLLTRHMRSNFGMMLAILARAAKKQDPLPYSFWQRIPRHSRIFGGNLQMSLQNENYSQAAFRQMLDRIDLVQTMLAGK